tara:strand:- start:2795 stop:3700 length:906 start_codon:yes stop_codon:yes gene_type:complete
MITFDKIGNLGRLANQMFQYSLLYSVAKHNNFEFVLPKENLKNIVDSGFNPVINKRESMYLYLPECFNITGKFLPKSEIHSKYFYDHGRDYAKYSPEVFNISDNTNIKGYFQSYKYFDNIKDDIKKEFTFKEEIEKLTVKYFNDLKSQFNVKTITGVHVRHGDVKNEKGARLVLLNKEYYIKAMNMFKSSDNLFIIFSDDIPWCKENLKGPDIVYSKYSTYEELTPKAEYLDLCCMTHCNNLVIACSSFSWWGAYINKNNGKIVVPDKWWGPQYSDRKEQDIRPPEWIQLKAESNYKLNDR